MTAAACGAVLVLTGLGHGAGRAARVGAVPAAGPSSTSAARPVRPPEAVRASWRPGAPRRLVIPSLGVAAPVVPVRAPGRTLVPPADPATLGWWADGARPGERSGRVLIAGHSVHGAGHGALEGLDRLRRGAVVVVTTEAARVRYVVDRVAVLDKAALSSAAVSLFGRRAAPRLVLVTCADWDGRRFLSNVVVVARPAPREPAGPVE